MSRQTSNKTGLHSLVSKTQNSRHALDPQPSAQPVAGASGKRKRPNPTDIETSLLHDTKRRKREQTEGD